MKTMFIFILFYSYMSAQTYVVDKPLETKIYFKSKPKDTLTLSCSKLNDTVIRWRYTHIEKPHVWKYWQVNEVLPSGAYGLWIYIYDSDAGNKIFYLLKYERCENNYELKIKVKNQLSTVHDTDTTTDVQKLRVFSESQMSKRHPVQFKNFKY